MTAMSILHHTISILELVNIILAENFVWLLWHSFTYCCCHACHHAGRIKKWKRLHHAWSDGKVGQNQGPCMVSCLAPCMAPCMAGPENWSYIGLPLKDERAR